jgi:hypothetical protein
MNYDDEGYDDDAFDLFDDPDYFWDEYDQGRVMLFANPGSGSSLRVATPDNPRDLPCPTCGEPDRLTPEDRALGYQCDDCAEGWGY